MDGDIVVDILSSPRDVYVSILDDNLGNALTDTSNWSMLGTEYYNAGVFNPTGDTYPTTTGETSGAMYFVAGLGVDNSYTYTAGTLSGTTLQDDDKLTWVSGAIGSEVWLVTYAPRITNELGGIGYVSATAYVEGDLVTEGGLTYINILAGTGSLPSTTPLSWKPILDDAVLATLDEVTDVVLTTAAEGDILVYDATAKLWENKVNSVVNLSDTPSAALVAGDAGKILQINSGGTAFEYTDTISGGTY